MAARGSSFKCIVTGVDEVQIKFLSLLRTFDSLLVKSGNERPVGVLKWQTISVTAGETASSIIYVGC